MDLSNTVSNKGEEQCGDEEQNETEKSLTEQQQSTFVFSEIPELPSGELLRFDLLSPWDDPNFIGISSIELFTEAGVHPPITEIWTNATETTGDLQKLVGVRKPVNDPSQMWLCNYRTLADSQSSVSIHLHFQGTQTLALIRIWNYASSRVHALRGVRNLRIWLDNSCIFYGEICCAFCGTSADDAPENDTILFTTNEEILMRIAEHDEEISYMASEVSEDQLVSMEVNLNEAGGNSDEQGQYQQEGEEGGQTRENRIPDKKQFDAFSAVAIPQLSVFNRPTTGHQSNASSSSASSTDAGGRDGDANEMDKRESNQNILLEGGTIEEEEENIVTGKLFHMELLANWGCPDAIGLTGVQFIGPRFEPLCDSLVRGCTVRCEPANHGSGEHLESLLNGRNLTCRTEEMWLSTAWDAQATPLMLSFTFPQEIQLTGISIWNYNASPELSYAGVRCARFYANGRLINGIGTVLLRKAPGFVFFDYVQDVLFDRCPLIRPISSRPQTRSVAAFIFQLRLLSSWGDEFYIGLNGIELFNRRDQHIRLRPQNVAAFPESVNCLSSVYNDPRTSDKLINGVNDTTKAHHMWLTPILPNSFARIFIIFDSPTFVTRIRIYNYRKTPERGVRHIALSADDLLICSEEIPMSTAEETGILDIPLRDSD